MNVESTGGRDPRTAPDQRPAPPAFCVTDAVVAYERAPVLRGVTFDVPAGQTLAILGPNGSGKSTLMRAMLGITPLVSGRVEVYGTRLSRFRDWARIGYVPQRLSAGGGVPATVREVVASGQVARRRRLRRATRDDHSAVASALASVGLTDRANDSVHELSGGQQQRVLIARALAGRPDTFVMDEPMAGVDSGSQEALADTIRALSERGATVVLVLHELGPLEPLIQRSLVLSEGRIAHDGPAPRRSHDHIHPHAGEAPAPTAAVPDIEVPRLA